MALKSDESERVVPLHSDVEEALKLQEARVAAMRRAAGPLWQEHGLLFPSAVGTPQDARNVIRAWHALRTRAGLGTLRFHDLRHGYATLLKQQGVELATIKELLGHSSITITDQFYGHLVPTLHHAAAAKIGSLITGAKVAPTGEPTVSQSAANPRKPMPAGARNKPDGGPAHAGAGKSRDS